MALQWGAQGCHENKHQQKDTLVFTVASRESSVKKENTKKEGKKIVEIGDDAFTNAILHVLPVFCVIAMHGIGES